jgi:hypothetical protein
MKRAVSSAPTISIRAKLLSGFILILVAACGSNTPPRIAELANVTITLDGKRHSCVVTLYEEPQGSTVACKDVVPFVRDELRLQPGSIYDIHTVGNVADTETTSVAAALDGAGYRFIGGRKLP